MKAKVKWSEGLQFVGTAESGHALVLDTHAEVGGLEAGPSPMELVLLALGGCTGMDVVSILKKMRVEWARFEIGLEAERAEEHPKAFTKIHLTYRIWGADIPEDKLKKAIDLSLERYCSVGAMLGKRAKITYDYHINPERSVDLPGD
jgi:putative redox protein